MNTHNLILTSTAGMSREEWLEWRNPLNHVKKWIEAWLIEKQILHDNGVDYVPSELTYKILQQIFSSQEWKDFVFPCIGGSEIASVMGLNKYESSIELYFKKVGLWPSDIPDNAAMFWGRELEAQIADKWQYWDGNAEGMMSNYAEDKIVRKCRRLNAYVQNKRFPWLYVSVDRIINKQGETPEGTLECKTISAWAADQWEAGFPPSYVVQIQQQIGVLEFGYGESAILKDGREMEVLPFDKSETIFEAILKRSEAFYTDVKKGIEYYLLSLVAPDEETRNNCRAIVDKLAPEPDNSDAYANYLKQKHEDKGYEINGNDTEYGWAQEYDRLKGEVKTLEETQTLYSNKLKNVMGEASTLNFGEHRGKVTWKADKTGKRTFKVKLV